MNKKINVIIADDHQIVIDGIKSLLLGESNYQVIFEASNGQEVIEFITTSKIKVEVVITDISMPLLNGIELCKILKHDFPEIKVLILSMYDSHLIVREVLKVEADGFILKNSGREELFHAINKIVDDGTHFSKNIVELIHLQENKNKIQKMESGELSKREIEILSLIVKEFSSIQISEQLYISKKTVDNHRMNILKKLKCNSTIGLVKYAISKGIV